MTTIEFSWRHRDCECCGNPQPEELFRLDFFSRNKNDQSFHFRDSICICPVCGFVYVNPVPHEPQLNVYYASSYLPYFGQALDYDYQKRIGFILDNVSEKGTFVDFGSRVKSEFHRALEEEFASVLTVELNPEGGCDRSSLHTFSDESIDVLAAYFVLEHLPFLNDTLSLAGKKIKNGGVLIIEVPDIALYGKDISALILHEHMNHFSLPVLERIAKRVGFSLTAASRESCSRSYGFVAAFRKDGITTGPLPGHASSYHENRKHIERGLVKVRNFFASLESSWNEIRHDATKGKKVLLWGINDAFIQFIQTNSISTFPDSVTLIDSNPQKKSFFDNFSIHTPDEVSDRIHDADAIYVFTRRNCRDILTGIQKNYGKVFPEKAVTIVYF